MARAGGICNVPGCPRIVPSGRGKCPDHKAEASRAYDATRPSREDRGYDAAHRRARADIAPTVEAGGSRCWRCGEWIRPGTEWDLGHDDHDRTIILGPEHMRCNRATRTAGRMTTERDAGTEGDGRA